MMNVFYFDFFIGCMFMLVLVECLFNGFNKFLFVLFDLDEVCFMVGCVMKLYWLDFIGQGECFDVCMYYILLGDLLVSCLCYGLVVQIELGVLESFFLVQMFFYGMVCIESGVQYIDFLVELVLVLSLQEVICMIWMVGIDQLMLCLLCLLVECILVGYFGYLFNELLCFELGFCWCDCVLW